MRDAAIIDTDKLNPREARHADESAFKNLTEQENLATTDVLIKLLNTKLVKLCKEINPKHLKLRNNIAYYDGRVKKTHTKIHYNITSVNICYRISISHDRS